MTGASPGTASGESRWTGGRIFGMVAVSFVALVGVVMLLGGAGILALYGFARDDDGFYTSDSEPLRSPGSAIVTDDFDLGNDVPEGLLGTVRVRAESTDTSPVFVGIGPTQDVTNYLGRAAYTRVTDFSDGNPVYAEQPGGALRRPPGSQGFWVASSEGAGERAVEWDVEGGSWTIAVLNADARRGVDVDADIGAKVGWVLWVGLGLTLVGLVITIVAILVVISLSRRASRDGAAAPPPSGPDPPPPATS